MLITNGTIVTLGADNRVIEKGALLVEGERIAEIGSTRALEQKYPGVEKLDARGRIVMPGCIVAHTHFYGAFARGMSLPPGPPPKNFVEILQKLWWRIDRALTLEDCTLSALVCLVDAVRHGTTTLIDHHASPNAIDGSLDAVADAVLESGLRASLCYEVTDRNGAAGARAGRRENVRFIRQLKTQKAEVRQRLAAAFGVHASFTVSDRTLDQCLDAASGLDTGFHIHVAEDRADQDDALEKFKLRVGERLESRGL
ncbi:MAG: amidohydrolase family protein, partial [Chloroflexi bacterium]|nr:amidohydrolase family protein [Chloroflexota bacterium]